MENTSHMLIGQDFSIMKQKYFATFSNEDFHPITKEPMEGFYLEIDAEDEEAARFAIFDVFHDNWKMLYTAKEFNKSSCPKGQYASCVAKAFNPQHDIRGDK